MNYPITLAIRVLREKKVEFAAHIFEYVEKGGTKHSSEVLGVDEHSVVHTQNFRRMFCPAFFNVFKNVRRKFDFLFT